MFSKSLFTKFISIASAIVLVAVQGAVSTSAKAKSKAPKTQASLDRQLQSIRNNIRKKTEDSQQLDNNIRGLQSKIDEGSKKLAGLNQVVEEKQARVEELKTQVDSAKEALDKRIVAIEKSEDPTAVGILLGASNFEDFVDRADLVQKVSKHDFDLIETYSDKLSDYEKEKKAVEQAKSDTSETQENLKSNRSKLEKELKSNISSISSLKKEEARIAFEKKKLEEELSRIQSNYRNDNYDKGRYIWPVPGHNRISSPFGGRRNHKGIDISAPEGTPIVAVADGVVIKANSTDRWGSGWGYHVMVAHGNGYATQYAHCCRIIVSVGQHVKAGQVRGYVGNTGHSFGAHLHFETWLNGHRYNPTNEI